MAEGESNVRNINQQQSLRLTAGQNFAPTIAEVGGGVTAKSESYDYSVSITGSGANQAALAIAAPKTQAIQPVQGRVALITDASGQLVTVTLVCRTDQIAAVPLDSSVCPTP